jgi:hypothetical protein
MRIVTFFRCVVTLVCASSLHAQEQEEDTSYLKAASKPIEIAPGTILQKDVDEAKREWAMRTWLPKAAETWKGKEWEQEALDFAEAAIGAIMTPRYNEGDLTELVKQAKELLNKDVRDALIGYLASQVLYRQRFYVSDSETALRMACEHVEDAQVSGSLACAIFAASRYRTPSFFKKEVSGVTYLFDAIRRSLTDGSYEDADMALLVRHLYDLHSVTSSAITPKLDDLEQVYSTAPLPDWVKDTLCGAVLSRKAWRARGGGYGYTVGEEASRKFYEFSEQAKERLERSWKAKPDLPQTAVERMYIAMGIGEPIELQREWFDRAIAVQLDYEYAYTRMLWALRPRWGGSLQTMLEFGKVCAATRRYDTIVPEVLLKACADVAEEGINPVDIHKHESVREAIGETAQGYLDETSQSKTRRSIMVGYSLLASYLADQPEITAKAIEQAGDSLHFMVKSRMGDMRVHMREIKLETRIANGELGAEAQQLERLIRQRDMKRITEEMEQLDADKLPEEAAGRAKALKAMLGFHAELEKGDWVKLATDSGLTMFGISAGDWQLGEDGSL